MKKAGVSLIFLVTLLIAANGSADPVEYVRICSLYGAGFHYIPGTDVCLNDATGDARQQTTGGTWRSILPYPEGNWVSNPRKACKGRLVKVGKFASTDFTLNDWERKETAPVNVPVQAGESLSRVIMSGGFYDPRVPSEGGVNGSGVTGGFAFCVRSKDPTVFVPSGDSVQNPPYGNGLLPIGCVANSRIVNVPAAYSISPTAQYPNVFSFFPTADQTVIAGPFVYGKQLVVTTDMGTGGENLLKYQDTTDNTFKPMAGSLNVWVCVVAKGLVNDQP